MSEVDVLICSSFIGDLYGFSPIDFAISFCLDARQDKEHLTDYSFGF